MLAVVEPAWYSLAFAVGEPNVEGNEPATPVFREGGLETGIDPLLLEELEDTGGSLGVCIAGWPPREDGDDAPMDVYDGDRSTWRELSVAKG